MRFGGHETFPVREGWLTKGLRLVATDPVALDAPDAADRLGVGRNMAKSIRHWLLVTGLAARPARHQPFQPTALGEVVLRDDPFMLEPATWWALHCNLVVRKDAAVTWSWFFNAFGPDRFDRMICVDQLARFAAAREHRQPSRDTLHRDILCLLASYARPVPPRGEDPEEDIVAALRAAAEAKLGKLRLAARRSDDLFGVLDAIATKVRRRGHDRIVIVWDEFGRHLEALASGGRPEELSLVQQVAEWAVRQGEPAATFSLLLHQNIFHYAAALSQSARNAWRKIEGRFASLRFVDDSREMHQLIAWVVEQSRPADLELPAPATFEAVASRARELGFFDGFDDQSELAATLAQAYPLAPAALHLLPRLAARMAQNERTVFSFLHDADLSGPVTLRRLFDGFAEAMRADTGAGGAHRRWLEAHTALSKTDSALEAEAIAAAALLGLGHAGQRLRLSLDALHFALDEYDARPVEEIREAVRNLVARKLLLHRERTDDITVWHGTDLDLRGRLEAEKRHREADFDPVAYIATQHPAEAWRPVEHNLRHGVRRYFPGAYVNARELLREGSEHPLFHLDPGEDGRIIFAFPSAPGEIEELDHLAQHHVPAETREGIILVVPASLLPIAEVALEGTCLDALQKDAQLVGQDPFALPEIQHMADAAHETLRRQLARLTWPGPDARWYAQGQQLHVARAADLRAALSRIADARFPETPSINNELIVRKALSRPMVNARKKVLLGVLEHAGQPALGFAPEATTPDASIYRTVLELTGLYRRDGGSWRWARPEEPGDVGLRAVWALLAEFFATPGTKEPASLMAALQAPPYGLRFGVMPVLLAAALKAFGRAVAIRREGTYLPDILASEIEDLCARPEHHSIEVVELDDTGAARLKRLVEIFGVERAGRESDVLRWAWDALQGWQAQLPPSALRSRQVSPTAREFQAALRTAADPVALFFGDFPKIAGAETLDEDTLATIDDVRRELEAIVTGYQLAAIAAIRETLALSSEADGASALTRAHAWAACFVDQSLPRDALDGTARALLQQASEAAAGRRTEASFARALSTILIGKDFDKWDDRTPRQFASRLRAVADQIETTALKAEAPAAGLRPLVETRVAHLVDKLYRIAEPDEVRELLDQLRRDDIEPGDLSDGQPDRRAS